MPKLHLTLSLIFCLHLLAFSQSDSAHITTIASKLQKLSATRPVEKVYLALNKPGYNVGDTIWFKGYVTVGEHHQPSALSGVLYAELIDGKDKIIQSLRLKNNNGISVGDFAISDKLLPGDYRIRAYTNWMRNAGSDYFFNQTISIGNIKTDAVFINSSYALNGGSVNTRLTYTDKLGRPFDRREVSYQVRADSNLLYAGKGITDASGSLAFTFPGQTAPGQHLKVASRFKLSGDVFIDKTTSLNIPNQNMDIRFFPEGGELVNGVRSRIAFKAVGTNGLGVAIKGAIVDNENNEVAYFQSQHAGMGVFALTPQSGKTYTAKIAIADNQTITTKLPAANDKGFVLGVSTNPDDSTKLNVRVATNEATLGEKKGQGFYITGQSGGDIYYTTAGKLDNASFIASVPKNKFPSGIAQFTLFSNTNEPLNERVVFIQNNTDLLNLDLKTAKTTYAPKEKVSMVFNAKDNNNKPVQGSFSLSVYNEDRLTANENAESTILSNILLTSDLKGYIEEPNYYFNQPTDHTKVDLDILMLTQGYRRFEWKEIMADNYAPISFKPERSLSLSGTLTDASGKPVVKGKVSVLSVADKISVDTTSDEQGRFTLAGLDFPDTTKQVLIQARTDNNDKEVNILLDNKTTPVIYKNNMEYASQNLFPPLLNNTNKGTGNADTTQIVAAIRNYNFAFKQNNKLKEVTITQKKLTGNENAPWVPIVTRSANLNGPGHADQIFDSKSLESCQELLECIFNKIPGIRRVPTIWGEWIYFFERHMAQSIEHTPGITYMLDGIFVDIDDIRYLNVTNIETVEILKNGSYLSVYGTGAPGGLIIITTKNGVGDENVDYNSKVSPGVITTKFNGFYKAKEFYLPKYTAKDTYINDTRDAVYWNPNIVTDANGTFPIEYFNSDVKGTYRAVVEGIDNDGNIGRFVYRYKVE